MRTLEITTTIPCKNMCSYCPQKLLISKYNGPKYLSILHFIACLYTVPKEKFGVE